MTDYHAKLYAAELNLRRGGNGVERLTGALAGARVDLNPHQVDAALFAFRSPLSRGAILADEVGLGKTIEAGIVLAQKWAEHKRRLLLILPVNLRRQWQLELEEKFYLPSVIVNGREELPENEVAILSYGLARNRADELRQIPWDMAVIDEAHRLRNVYKNGNITARRLKEALSHAPKLLLTATPLQNSLLELYGLTGFIDEHVFGDLRSFRDSFGKLKEDSAEFAELRRRLRPVCTRTLRRQAKYIRFTRRIAHTQEFISTAEEDTLYERMSEYLRRPEAVALPPGQRTLLTLVLRKLLASSPAAIAAALDALCQSLERRYALLQKSNPNEPLSMDEDSGAGLLSILCDYDTDELDGGQPELVDRAEKGYSYIPATEEMKRIVEEATELVSLRNMARQLKRSTKAEALLAALKSTLKDKALVFTESRKTQEFLYDFLLRNGFSEDDLILFNGSVTAKKRPQLVEQFRTGGKVMIATEAGAEGLNLQFCSLVINYDLPWNPQRIEQRIGRCHRYGQKNDVVVVNFLNRNNAADRRVFQLLDEKFRLFDGVFGSSDEVLGAIESGVDFEKRIVEILQCCRTEEEIQTAFDRLQAELSGELDEAMRSARRKLLDHFDTEVAEKLQVYREETRRAVSRHEKLLWELTCHELRQVAEFDLANLRFRCGNDRYGFRPEPGAMHYRLGHPLADRLIRKASERKLEGAELHFDLSKAKITILNGLAGKSGVLTVKKFTASALDTEEFLIYAGTTDRGEALTPEQVKRLFDLPAEVRPGTPAGNSRLENLLRNEEESLTADLAARNESYFEEEMEKLDRWAEDCKRGIELQIRETDLEIKKQRGEVRKQPGLEGKVKLQRHIKTLETRRNEMRRRLFLAQDEIDEKKETLLDEVEKRLRQSVTSDILLHIRWSLKN